MLNKICSFETLVTRNEIMYLQSIIQYHPKEYAHCIPFNHPFYFGRLWKINVNKTHLKKKKKREFDVRAGVQNWDKRVDGLR